MLQRAQFYTISRRYLPEVCRIFIIGITGTAKIANAPQTNPTGEPMAAFDELAGTNSCDNPLFSDVLLRRMNRRGVLGLGAGASMAGLCAFTACAAEGTPASLTFTEVPHGIDEQLTVPDGYQYQVLLRWGDPIMDGAPAFDLHKQSRVSQEQQFGYNNDFIGFVPLPAGSGSSSRGLLVVNHEYTDASLMFADAPAANALSLEQTEVEIAAHGLSVVEIRREGENWQVVTDSGFNRRITPLTPMRFTGPAAGSPRLHTLDSDDGIKTWGTYGNCAGGVTPWGTILTGEENVDAYFSGIAENTDEAENYRRFGMGLNRRSWGLHFPRWDLVQNPHEALHVGWIVEIDPFDPDSVPMKRSGLGRMKHEGCNIHVGEDGTVVAYTGDDARFEYLYKFVSANRYDPDNRSANMTLLAEGILHVAQFNEDGTLRWLPMIYGEGPLTRDNGFNSQGDVLIDARKAADLLGATKMDRPEDVDVNEVTGHVFAMLTNNSQRTAEQIDAVNPRAANGNGQIVEFWPESGNHADETFRWELFLLAGNPAEDDFTAYHPGTSENGWLSCPDNCAFDNLGNIWIATDGAEGKGIADGVWAAETQGEHRALTRRFLRTPVGAELCGPFFTPDNETLFCAVQHPGQGSGWNNPDTRWPDFDVAMPPRPAVVAITKTGGGRIGS